MNVDGGPDDVNRTADRLMSLFAPTLRIEPNDIALPCTTRNVLDLAFFPEDTLRRLIRWGLRDIHLAERGIPYLDSNDDLRGEKIPGANRWWSDVPGAFRAELASVSIGAGRSASISVALHEMAHALGALGHWNDAPALIRAHQRLFRRLPPWEAAGGPGGAGRREMFAEGVAYFLKRGPAATAERYDGGLVTLVRTALHQSSRDEIAGGA